jgi:hypothetical protein
MSLADSYKIEAFHADKSAMPIVNGDVSKAAMVSFVPLMPALPRHDLVGLPFVRKFGRGFVRALGGGLKDYVYCVVCKTHRVYVKASDGTVLVTPPDYELYI